MYTRFMVVMVLGISLASCKGSSRTPPITYSSTVPTQLPSDTPLSAPASAPTQTPASTATLEPAPLPDEDPVYLADLKYIYAHSKISEPGYGIFTEESNLFHKGDPLEYKGQAFPRGIYAPAITDLTYNTIGFDTFKTDIFVAGPGTCRGDGVIVSLMLDNKNAYISPWIFSGQPLFHIELDVSGAKSLQIRVTGGPAQDINCDYAVLGDPYFTRKSLVERLPVPKSVSISNGKPVYELYVAPSGDDHNPGTREEPFATLRRARDAARVIPAEQRGAVTVFLRGGEYFMDQPLVLEERNSGEEGAEIVYRAFPGETPVLSAGRAVKGWQPVEGSAMWQAPLDDPYIRQVYVNGQRATLARLTGTFTAIEWAKGPLHDDDGLVLQQDAVFDSLLDARHLVFHWVMEWKDMVMLVDRIEKRADGSYVAWMLQPDWNAVFTMRMPDQFTYPQPGRSFFIENAQVLVNEPGEFYADIEKRMLYYMPRPGEDMATAQVIVSAREQLLRIQGYRIGEEVHDLAFEGLTFAYAGWNFSSLRSRFGWQAESFLVSSAYNAEAHPSTAVWVNGAQRIRFIRNRWQHLGGTALELPNNVTHMTVDGNLMHDLGDASILAGREMQMYMDETEEAVCSDVRITNNLIQETGRENLAGPAMMVYFGRNFTIAHNELRHYPYTGLSLGWGWDSYPDSTSLEDNVVTANRFDQGMLIARDGGAIYTLANQHGTIISENYISNQWDWTGGIYLDAGSSFITVDSNVIENTVFWLNHNTPAVHDNIISNNFSNTSNWNNNGVELSLLENNTIVTGNVWPEAAQKIMTSAGLETAYQDLRSLVSQVNDRPFPMAQDGKVYLADYTPWYVFPAQFYDYRVGAFPFDSDIFKRDELLSYRGVAYPHGIFTYPQSGLNYYLGRNFISFDTEFFVVGPTQCRGSDGAFLSIELDNEIVYTGPKLRNGSDPIHIHINVTGAEFLSIGTFPGDNSRCDYAVLGDPYVSK